MEFDSNKLLYKSSEVSKMLGITQPTLKKIVKSGELACTIIASHRYFRKEDVMEYINDHTHFGKTKED